MGRIRFRDKENTGIEAKMKPLSLDCILGAERRNNHMNLFQTGHSPT